MIPDQRSVVEHVEDLPRIERALRRAIRDALAMHKRMGNPIAVWRDGAVEWVPPEEIVLDDLNDDEPPQGR